MRCLRRNKTSYWYGRYVDSGIAYDEWGNESGKDITYSKPVKAKANISPARNVDVIALFGTELNYDKVLCMDEAPFDENALLWIDTDPAPAQDGTATQPPDYIVKRIAPSLNSVLVAVSRGHMRYE